MPDDERSTVLTNTAEVAAEDDRLNLRGQLVAADTEPQQTKLEGEIIPVGQELCWTHPALTDSGHESGRQSPDGNRTPKGTETTNAAAGHKPVRRRRREDKAVGRLEAVRIFTTETMRSLKRSELTVWLAIFNCEFNGQARIGYSRLEELTGLSRRHVGEAIKSLKKKRLLVVLQKGRFRGNAGGDHASIYRTYPRMKETATSEADR